MEKNIENELVVFERKKRKLMVLVVVAVVIIVSIIVIFFKGYSSATKKYKEEISKLEAEVERLSDPIVQNEVASREVTIDLIKSEIEDIGELATVEYYYTDAGKFEDAAKIFGKDLPFSFTTKSFIAKWDGIIKAGVKIDKIIVEINDDAQEIIIHMPPAEILSHEIEDDSIETLDEKNGLFNPVKVDDVREFDGISKSAMEERAIENGVLDRAYENAKGIIEKFVNNDIVQESEYKVKFEKIM